MTTTERPHRAGPRHGRTRVRVAALVAASVLGVALAVVLAAVSPSPPARAQTTTAEPTTTTGADADADAGPTTTAEEPEATATTGTTAAGGTDGTAEDPSPTTTPTTEPADATTTTPTTAAPSSRPTVPEEPPEGFTTDQWQRVRNVVQACGAAPGAVCDQVLDWTGNRTLAESAQWLFDIPLRIALILAGALVLNWVVRRAIARHLVRITSRSQAAAQSDPAHIDRSGRRMATASSTLGSTATVVIFTIAGLVSLSELGIDLGPMLAGAGIAGIAIGFGAQNMVRDVLAGLFVILEDQYGVGDTIDAGGIAIGTVEEFTLRVTKLRDVEGTLWFIPNGIIEQVGNKTQLWARAILDIEVAYGADHRRAGELIKQTADRIWREQRPGERIIEEPELWGVERLGESGVAIRLAVKSAPAEQWKVARTLRSEIKDALDAEGFEIPFPQRAIWIRTEGPGTEGDGATARLTGDAERG